MKNCQQRAKNRFQILSFYFALLISIFFGHHLVLADLQEQASGLGVNSNSTVVLQKNNESKCSYSSDLVENENEAEVKCIGKKFVKIPQIKLENVTRFILVDAKITVLREGALQIYSSTLKDLFLTNLDELHEIEPGAFKNITQLREISITNSPNLHKIHPETFRHISNKTFKTLKITDCGLKEIPDMRLFYTTGILIQVNFEGNLISEIPENSIRIKTELLNLGNNVLTTVHNAAFNGSEIVQLSLKGNTKLRKIHELAFKGVVSIRELDLSGTSILSLPSIGLENLEELKIENTQSLKQIPSVYNFIKLERAYLTHSFHCCAFKYPSRHDPTRHREYLDLLKDFKLKCKGEKSFLSDSTSALSDRSKRSIAGHDINSYNVDEATENSQFFDDGDVEGFFHEPVQLNHTYTAATCGNLSIIKFSKREIKCVPVPDALNPCEDVMGSNWLRVSVWIVVALTVIGNVCVLVVLFSNRSELTVPKFLMCNLAFADFSMGLYLLLIASIDLHSMGEYFNFAFDWQYGLGCQTAGFLTVFAGHLSIFTLTIITVERWFAITNAIYLNKRLKLKNTIGIMIGGWIYSICMASLPLFGISNYSSTSICLPMEAIDPLDVAYLITVLAVNGLGFFIVCICYSQIYFSLGTETRTRSTTSGEMTIAKKFALLVFTNFACWAPIAFFGLTALAGYPLIDVTGSKILLVFFYPINSCANPYLYAILTAQYRRDFFLLLSKFGICTKRAQKYKLNFSNHTNTIPLNQISNRTNNSNHHTNSRSSKKICNHNNDGHLLSFSPVNILGSGGGEDENDIRKYNDIQV